MFCTRKNYPKNLEDYCLKNKLFLNCSKTKYMIFNYSGNIDHIPPLKLLNEEIVWINSCKFLGFHLQNDLKWTDEINYI